MKSENKKWMGSKKSKKPEKHTKQGLSNELVQEKRKDDPLSKTNQLFERKE